MFLKLFELSVHEVKDNLVGEIFKMDRCYSSLIRFGNLGLSPLLEEAKLCCWGAGEAFQQDQFEGVRMKCCNVVVMRQEGHPLLKGLCGGDEVCFGSSKRVKVFLGSGFFGRES